MHTLSRHPKWSERLSAYLARQERKRFHWGSHDCALFTNGAIKALTGTDLASQLRGQYATKIEAAQLLRRLEHGTLKNAMTAYLGEPVHCAQAQRGDIVMRDKALGVCTGTGWSVFVGEQHIITKGKTKTRHGLVHLPTLECECAWKVAEPAPDTGAM